jgi:hypothetical protein
MESSPLRALWGVIPYGESGSANRRFTVIQNKNGRLNSPLGLGPSGWRGARILGILLERIPGSSSVALSPTLFGVLEVELGSSAIAW